MVFATLLEALQAIPPDRSSNVLAASNCGTSMRAWTRLQSGRTLILNDTGSFLTLLRDDVAFG